MNKHVKSEMLSNTHTETHRLSTVTLIAHACLELKICSLSDAHIELRDLLHTVDSRSALQLTPHTVSVTWAVVLSKCFSYPNTLQSQHVRISDFLLYHNLTYCTRVRSLTSQKLSSWLQTYRLQSYGQVNTIVLRIQC